MKTTRVLAASLLAAVMSVTVASADERTPHPPQEKWSFAGTFGRFDQAQLQRGFQVYKEVCSSCHSMSLVRFRNLSEEGGPGFTTGQVKELAAQYKVKEQNDAGEDVDRPARAADAFPSPFPN